LKRSSRLILLIGIFLAVIAFVGGVLLLSGGSPGGAGQTGQPTQATAAFASADIALGFEVTANNCQTQTIPVTQKDPTSFVDCSVLIGRVVRQPIKAGHQFVGADFQAAAASIEVPPGFRAMAVQVDQLSGVGTLINPGDYVDVVVGITGDKFPVITVDPKTNQITPITGLNATSVKLLVQGLQVLDVLLPPATTQQGQQPGAQATASPQPALTGQQAIVILAVTAQQAEVIKFAQMDGQITLVLRSSKDFRNPKNPSEPFVPTPTVTTGIILKTLVDEYGVLPPQVVQTVLPAGAR
jgi:pilus assembly protein CpaB